MSLTPEGKAISSQNALKSGLFATGDFIRNGEESEYTQTLESLLGELTPEGILENTFTAEIMGATWRLRRCRLLESTFDMIEDETLLEKQQKSVDRARAQSHNILRKSMSELRKLQTERQIRLQLEIDEPSGLADTRQILNAMKLNESLRGSQREEQPEEEQPEEEQPESSESLQDFEEMLRRELMITDADEAQYPRINPPKASSFCKTAAPAPAVSRSLPRNKPCPCGSGMKYKKCCGGPAVQEATQAA